MNARLVRSAATAALCALAGVIPGLASSQSVSQTAAWDGLTLSPVGALAPLARVSGELFAGSSDITFRYGRWRYDPDDAVHDSFGVTWSRGLRNSRFRLDLTAGYALVECPTCSASLVGGIDLQSTLLQHGSMKASAHEVQTSLGARLSLGGARNLGSDRTTAGSTAVILPLDLALPIGRSSSLSVSLQPGIGYGHIASPDFGDGGVLPMLGAAISIHSGSRLGVHVGMERIVITGGPATIGASFSWMLR